MKLDSLKAIFIGIVSCTLIVAVLMGIVALLDTDRKNYKVDDSWKDGVGTLVELEQSEGGSKFKYEYCGGVYWEYSIHDMGGEGIVTGEMYKLKINPTMPDKYVPIEWEPVFAPAEKTILTKGPVIRIFDPHIHLGSRRTDLSYDVLRYQYRDSNMKVYTRTQSMPLMFKEKYPNVVVGKQFVVEYLKGRPQRAVIYIDRPAD